MNNRIIYDEIEMGRVLLQNGYANGYTFRETLLYAKYLRSEGETGKNLKEKIIGFIKEKDVVFAKNTRFSMIKEIMKRSTMPPISTGEVNITLTEIEAVKEIKNFKHQKIALAILLISKRIPNKGIINIRSFRDIKAVVGNKITRNDILQCLFQMKVLSLVDVYDTHKFNSPAEVWYKILFSSDDGKIIFSIKTDQDARALPKMYETYCGGQIGYCIKCEKEFIRKNNYQRLCAEHAATRKHRRVYGVAGRGANTIMDGSHA